MTIQTVLHIGETLRESKEVVERLLTENLENKINSYLKKFDKQEAVGKLELSVEKNKKGLFDGKLIANMDGHSFRYEREDYKNLDDLINHLFDHFKESLSNEKERNKPHNSIVDSFEQTEIS